MEIPQNSGSIHPYLFGSFIAMSWPNTVSTKYIGIAIRKRDTQYGIKKHAPPIL